MKRILMLAVILSITAIIAGCGEKADEKVLVEVGSKKITEGDLTRLAEMNPKLKVQLSTPFGKKNVVRELVDQELLYQGAVKEGLDKSPLVEKQSELLKKYVIIPQTYLNKTMEEAVGKYYEEHKKEFEKLKLSHIFISFKTDDKDKKKRSEKDALDLANKIKARIDGGADFAEVAKEASEDTMTNKRGGDLGFVSSSDQRLARRGLSPLLEKAFTMKEGEVAGPIKTEKGYSIITVTKGVELQPFDEVKEQISFKIRGDVKNDVLERLKKDIKVTYFMEELKEELKQVEKKPEQKDESAEK